MRVRGLVREGGVPLINIESSGDKGKGSKEARRKAEDTSRPFLLVYTAGIRTCAHTCLVAKKKKRDQGKQNAVDTSYSARNRREGRGSRTLENRKRRGKKRTKYAVWKRKKKYAPGHTHTHTRTHAYTLRTKKKNVNPHFQQHSMPHCSPGFSKMRGAGGGSDGAVAVVVVVLGQLKQDKQQIRHKAEGR